MQKICELLNCVVVGVKCNCMFKESNFSPMVEMYAQSSHVSLLLLIFMIRIQSSSLEIEMFSVQEGQKSIKV